MAKIPEFKNEDQERAYWDQHSPLDHMEELPEQDTVQVKERRSKIQISLRIRPDLKEGIEELATARGIPYQTLIHSWVMERYYAESRSSPMPAATSPQLLDWIEKLVESRTAEIEARLRKSLLESLPFGPAAPTKRPSRSHPRAKTGR